MTPDLFAVPEPKAKRGSRLPEDWKPTPQARAFASSLGLDPDLEYEQFRDFWTSKPSKNTSTDWLKNWRMWCRNVVKWKPKPFKSRFEQKPIEPPPATEWGPRLRGYKPGGFWSPMWGFRPESGMCGAPKAEIEKWLASVKAEA